MTCFSIIFIINQQSIADTQYKIIENSHYGYVVDILDNLHLEFQNLKIIPIKFNRINGSFNCDNNELTSLIGCPEIVGNVFNSNYNRLKNLKYCPKIIQGNLWINENVLNTLKYFPEKVDGNCFLDSNPELGEVQNIKKFDNLKKIHDLIILNKNLEKEIIIEKKIISLDIKIKKI